MFEVTKMSVLYSHIEADGRVLLPAQVMEELDLQAGTDIEFRVQDGTVRVLPSVNERVRRVQERMKKYIRPGRSVVDEFLAERRLEAENE